MNEKAEHIVPHPRFGNKPRASGCAAAVVAAREEWGEYFRDLVFPETAILGDSSKQNYSVSPRKYYVDTKKTCRDCGRYFIFFAEEQRHWYEDLSFFVDADCVRCPECRKAERTVRLRFDRYSRSIKEASLDDDSLATLVDDAVFLWDHAILKSMQTLYRLRKMACSRIPHHQATEKINTLIDLKRSQNAD